MLRETKCHEAVDPVFRKQRENNTEYWHLVTERFNAVSIEID